MAETFTSDNTPDAEVLTTEGEVTLSPEEQDSLQVGEKMVAEQEGLLAGKYKSAEDLEAAYLSLQQKLGEGKDNGVQEGQGNEAEEVEAKEEKTEEKEEATEATPAQTLILEASDEYYKNDGVLSEKTIEKFSSMSSQDLVNAYMEVQKNAPPAPTEQASLTDAQVNQVKNAAGGEAEYDKVVEWAAGNLDNKSIKAFDQVIDSGNLAAINIAFQGIRSKYVEANGYEGRMIQGKAPKSKGDVYRSQAELVAAMADPRYDNDPAYRADVIEKLSQSDVNF